MQKNSKVHVFAQAEEVLRAWQSPRKFHFHPERRPWHTDVSPRVRNVGRGSDGHGGERERKHIEFYRSVAPILWGLRVCGVHPLSGFTAESVRFRWLSPAVAYSAALVGALTVVGATGPLKSTGRDLGISNAFVEVLVSIMFASFCLQPVCVACMQWRDSCGLAMYLAKWRKFEAQVESTCDSRLRLRLRTRAACLVALCAAIAVSSTFFLPRSYQLVILPCSYGSGIITLSACLWHLTCSALCDTADHLAGALQRALRTGDAGKVASVRRCWLSLSALSREMGSAMGNTAFALMLGASFYITAGIFCILQSFSSPLSPSVLFGLRTSTICTLIILYLTCYGAERATNKIVLEVKEILLDIDVSTLSEANQKEVEHFLRAVSMSPPEIRIKRLLNVNVGLFASIMLTGASYLVILWQFKTSLTPMEDFSLCCASLRPTLPQTSENTSPVYTSISYKNRQLEIK